MGSTKFRGVKAADIESRTPRHRPRTPARASAGRRSRRSVIVAVKSANKGMRVPAESMERRTGANGRSTTPVTVGMRIAAHPPRRTGRGRWTIRLLPGVVARFAVKMTRDWDEQSPATRGCVFTAHGARDDLGSTKIRGVNPLMSRWRRFRLHATPWSAPRLGGRGARVVHEVRVVRGPEKPLRATSCRRKKFAGLSGTNPPQTAGSGAGSRRSRQTRDCRARRERLRVGGVRARTAGHRGIPSNGGTFRRTCCTST